MGETRSRVALGRRVLFQFASYLVFMLGAAAEQRRDFALPCAHPRAGRRCIALTKRKACRASLRWAKRVTRRRCLEQPE